MADVIDVIMRLTDQVTGPLRHIRNEVEQTARIHERLGRTVSTVGNNISSIGNMMLPVAGAITAVGAASAKTFMDFDATITAAGVKAGATAQEMEEMRRVAGRLGAEFPISAAEAAAGMDRLAAGGFDARQSIGAMPGIIKAAIASGEDLAATSDVVTSALSIWNLKNGDVAKSTEHIADVIQMSANVSKLGMQDFGLAMQYAGAPAAALGVNIEELGTAMAIMANNGIAASTIGTSLRAVMSRLASPPKAAAVAIEQLGLSLKDANGNFVGVQNAVDQMRNSMKGLSEMEQVAMAKAIAGEDAYSGLLALIKTSPENYAKVAEAINNSTGSSTAAFDRMQQTLKGSIDSMKGAVESLGIAMGTALTPYIKQGADAIKNIANAIAAMTPEQQTMIAQAAIAVVGITGLVLVFGKLISVAGTAISIYGQVGRVLAGGHIKNKLLEFSIRGCTMAYDGLGKSAISAASAVRSFNVGTAIEAGASKGSAVLTALRTKIIALQALSWATISNNIRTAFGQSVSYAAGRITWLTANIKAGMLAAKGVAVNVFSAITASLTRANIMAVASSAAKAIRGIGSAIMFIGKASLATMFSPIGIAIVAIAGAAYLLYANWNKVGPYFVNLWSKVKAAFQAAYLKIQPSVQQLMNAFSKLVPVLKSGASAILGALRQLMNTFSKLIPVIQSSVSTAFGALKRAMITLAPVFKVIGALIGALAILLGATLVANIFIVANVAVGAITMAANIISSVVTALIGVFTGIIQFITGVFTGDWAAAWQGIATIFESITTGIQGIFQGVITGIRSAINGLISGINTISFSAPDWVPGVGGQSFGPLNIPLLYTGTENWPGGPAMIHDRGAEIVDLPTGTRVIPHDRSLNMARQMGYTQGLKNDSGNGKKDMKFNITVNMGGVTMNGTKDIDGLTKQIVQNIYYEMQKQAVNMNVGAI